MSGQARILFGCVMTLALFFGFVHTHWPGAPCSFERLHIFGFNLLTGGSLILYHTQGRGVLTRRVKTYFALALLYALFAAFESYVPALILSVPLFLMVESVRIQRFSLFPIDFFRRAPVDEKFCQASLLCLSLAIFFASLVILNNEYLHLVDYPKLTIEVFFLGYSFPVSLITMSIMFSFMTEHESRLVNVLKEIGFWSVNLGVLVFFVFIIFEFTIPTMAVATTLFFAVWMIFFLFRETAPNVQQKTFLVSGMVFLLFTALTGIFYILPYFYPSLAQYREPSLVLHAMVSLYGWNLSGLFIIMRWGHFPIRLRAALAIGLHWVIVLVLAPLGKYVLPVAALAMLAYVSLLGVVLAGDAHEKEAIG
ncbi:MAG: hypothetical protein ACYTAF_16850 [Planctomycetota bacterium]|jgi:hypothetical protein